MMTERPFTPLIERLKASPVVVDPAASAHHFDELRGAVVAAQSAAAEAYLERDAVQRVLAGIFAHSPYLSGLVRRDPSRLIRLLEQAPETRMTDLATDLAHALDAAENAAGAMRAMRRYKSEVALLVALADIGGVWSVGEVTHALTESADRTVSGAVRYLFRQAVARGDWTDTAPDPETRSGYIVVAMGKHGARELNYSSDIDLIVFFEPELARLKPGLESLQFFVRLTRDLVRFMQERTEDGYVFRTDLRLRPDPGATQVAIAVPAALQYYESFGQNWERAALIKARPIAGDLNAGNALVRDLAPFIWRKYLDFAAIADIHAMKRQINAFRGFGAIGVAGHDVKLGRGGIREIEFFVQTQQLIAGGRQRDLRVPATLDALGVLEARGWIKSDVRTELTQAYNFLRRIEHHIQMLADEQTQKLPRAPEELERLAHFAGFATVEAFSAALVAQLTRVQSHYAQLFESTPGLSPHGANMVFAGATDDPDTIATLTRLGYQRPSDALATVRGWHHGRYAAVRSARARELLTEVQPWLIEELAKTADPDSALAVFDRFLAGIPSGIQLFSLLRQNPSLMRLVATIMGTAPRLARILARRRRALDAVLDPGFFGSVPGAVELAALLYREFEHDTTLEDALDRARIIGSEQSFLIGVRILSGAIGASEACGAYADLAQGLIGVLAEKVQSALRTMHGDVDGGGAVVIAMGKLGGREMTAASDLDLIVVYDFDPDVTQSNGLKPLSVTQYYARLTQRLISALSAPTSEGSLYEVDMRLRPSGQKGPVAAQFSTFVHYQAADAWTWEHMALTRARVVAGPADLRHRVEDAIKVALTRPRDRVKIARDVRDMRDMIAKEKGTSDIWDLKQVRGGLVDLEFIAQHLQLVHAASHPQVLSQNTVQALRNLADAGLLQLRHAEVLIPAAQLINNLTQILRLCLDGPFEPAKAPDGLKDLLARAGEAPNFGVLEADLRARLGEVAALFDVLVV